MAADDNNGARPAGPVVLRIKLRYDNLDAMVQRFAPNVGKSGLFLPTKSIQPIGTEVKFELRLINDTAVLVGLGRVKHVKHPDPNHPRAAFGMAIELMRVSREGREVIIRMIERRRALGLPDVAIPLPDDVETARRAEIDSQPRADTSNVVREAMSQLASTPVEAAVLSAPAPSSGPIAVAREDRSSAPIARDDRSSGPVARDDRSSGPVVFAQSEPSQRIPVPVLAAERSRRARPRVEELIETAYARAAELSSRIVLPTPELDMHVDIDRVLSRARALAGGDLDVELATLREAAATPVEINVEAASAELARQLGGKPIAKRERSARWSAPPPVEMKSELPPIVTRYPSSERKSEPQIAAVAQDAVTAVEGAVEAPEPRPSLEPSPSVVPEESYVIRRSAQLVAQRDADEYDDAFVPNASTTTSVDPQPVDPETLRAHEVKTDPAGQSGLLIDDDADISSFERALDAARIHTGLSKVAPPRPADDLDDNDDDPGADLLASGEYRLAEDDAPNESTIIGVSPIERAGEQFPAMSEQLAAQLDQQLAEADAERELAAGMAYERPYADGEELEDEEISDFDVLAEADEDDEDLLRAHGEADISAGHAAPDAYAPAGAYADPYRAAIDAVAAAPAPQAVDDFASRLDLGDDDEVAPPSDDIDRAAAREFDEAVAQPYAHVPQRDDDFAPVERYDEPAHVEAVREPAASYAYQRARRASSESSYTVADPMPHSVPQFAPHASGEEFDEPHHYSQPVAAPRGPDPRLLQHGRPTTQSTEDLEDALAALDVGRIDLEGRRVRRPTPSASHRLPGVAADSSRPLPGLPIERPRTGPVPIVQPAQQRVAHTVPRSTPPTAQQPVARAKAPTGAKPPPIPAAARKQTTQVPITKPATQQATVVQPPKRASTDEGVLIDFDDDE